MSKYKIRIERENDNLNQDKYDRMETIYEQTIEAEATAIQKVIGAINESWSLDRPSAPESLEARDE